jgi:hypothetical protein
MNNNQGKRRDPTPIRRDPTPIRRDPTLIPACPRWCGLQPGHEYDSIDHDGQLVRCHERIIADAFDVAVSLVQSETAGVSTPAYLPDPEIMVYAEGIPLSGSQARQLAGWLLIAAGEWEEART